MTERRLKRGLALLLTLCLAIPLTIAFADAEDAAEMAAYWKIVGTAAPDSALTRAMNRNYADLSLEALKAVTAEELLAFAAANQLPVAMARYAYYTALTELLAEVPAQTAAEQRISLFLAMKTNPRDKAANEERREIRKALTEADIRAYAAETGLPAGFLAWLLLDDEWYEVDWEEGDDWREGRRDWDFADWVDASDLREKYGKEAVVTDDDVERALRKNGYRFDD